VEPDVTSAIGRERQMAAPRRDFAVTLVDGRRVVGRYHDDAGEAVGLRPPAGARRADPRVRHRRHAGAGRPVGDDAGPALGRAGV
jgi:hypothetical protein